MLQTIGLASSALYHVRMAEDIIEQARLNAIGEKNKQAASELQDNCQRIIDNCDEAEDHVLLLRSRLQSAIAHAGMFFQAKAGEEARDKYWEFDESGEIHEVTRERYEAITSPEAEDETL